MLKFLEEMPVTQHVDNISFLVRTCCTTPIYSIFPLKLEFIEITNHILTIDGLGKDHFFAICKRRNFAHEQANLCSIITDHTPDGGILFF